MEEKRKKGKKNLLSLILLQVLIYTILLLFHFVYTSFINPDYGIIISDQIPFYNRGKGVLFGLIPYRDIYTNAAPLSPYLWVPIVFLSMLFTWDFSPEMVTSENYMYSSSMMLSSYLFRIFFVLCIILSSILVYKLEKRKNNKNAFYVTLFYSTNPFFLYLVSFWGSDEAIVPLLILLPIYLLEREKYSLATISIAIGAGLKYFPILLAPLIWIYTKNWKQRLTQTGLFLLLLAAFSLPFYLLSPENFLNQFNDPADRPGNQGILTIIQYTFGINLDPYTLYFMLFSLFCVGIGALYLFIRREKWVYSRTFALLGLYLLTYQKIQASYITMILPFVFVLIFEKGKVKWLSGSFFVFASAFGTAANIIKGRTASLFYIISSWIIYSIYYLLLVFFIIFFLFHNFEEKTSILNSSSIPE
ncbi:MAG: glycosyltransferase 87 family protein [Candidatus Heimdallarchaeaceae archaeon]